MLQVAVCAHDWRRRSGVASVALLSVTLAACAPPDGDGQPLDDPADVAVRTGALATDGCPVPGRLNDFHLTARPWTALGIPRTRYLDRALATATSIMQYQSSTGAIIDPNKAQEWQYSTPMFAAAVAVLIDAGRVSLTSTLGQAGLKAMDHASLQFSQGVSSIPQYHGEFFIAPLATTYKLLSPKVDAATAATWKQRLSVPVASVLNGLTNNWRTYAMKGEWLRVKAGLVAASTATPWEEDSWLMPSNTANSQWAKISHASSTDLFLYHDKSADPDTYAYESVARMNISSMLDEDYNGASVCQMTDFSRKGGETAVKFLDPTGQGAANGRSGDHSWNDVVPGTVYERLAERYARNGDPERAGRFRHAALLTLQSEDRWRRQDAATCPSQATSCQYSVTKNQFPSSAGVHYADYSAVTNYNGYMEYHLTESWQVNKTDIVEKPTWSEIGGYAFATDSGLAGVFANAGGMHVQAATRGQTGSVAFGQWWTALGVARFSRPGWDSRLGPSDGIRDATSKVGLTFAPTVLRGSSWVRLASIPTEYTASFSQSFVSPVLVRFKLTYNPTGSAQAGSPVLTQNFTVTPDGVFTTLTSSTTASFGVTYPLLVNDGGANTLTTSTSGGIASVRYTAGTDEQSFITIGSGGTLTSDGSPLRSGYGDLQSIRYVSAGTPSQTFVYPRTASDPTAASVRTSFVVTSDGFKSSLGTVAGNTYVGRASAGGQASSLDLNGDGTADVTFSASCKFVLQLSGGVVKAVEADRAVTFTYQGTPRSLAAFTPVTLP
jgi:hypothetical protein